MPKSKGLSVYDNPDGTRTCSVCGTTAPLNDYDQDKNAALGRRAQCKPCRSQRMKDWYATNRERQAQRQAERFKTNRDAIRLQDMERYRRHRVKRIALVTETGNKRRAELLGREAEAGISVKALRKRDGDQCCYCKCAMVFVPSVGRKHAPDRATIEHVIPLSRGGTHTWANVALACHRCNIRKNATPLSEWSDRRCVTRGGPPPPAPGGTRQSPFSTHGFFRSG